MQKSMVPVNDVFRCACCAREVKGRSDLLAELNLHTALDVYSVIVLGLVVRTDDD